MIRKDENDTQGGTMEACQVGGQEEEDHDFINVNLHLWLWSQAKQKWLEHLKELAGLQILRCFSSNKEVQKTESEYFQLKVKKQALLGKRIDLSCIVQKTRILTNVWYLFTRKRKTIIWNLQHNHFSDRNEEGVRKKNYNNAEINQNDWT